MLCETPANVTVAGEEWSYRATGILMRPRGSGAPVTPSLSATQSAGAALQVVGLPAQVPRTLFEDAGAGVVQLAALRWRQQVADALVGVVTQCILLFSRGLHQVAYLPLLLLVEVQAFQEAGLRLVAAGRDARCLRSVCPGAGGGEQAGKPQGVQQLQWGLVVADRRWRGRAAAWPCRPRVRRRERE